jgi:uncharacterized membrane protein YbhN (UPF0104 family)
MLLIASLLGIALFTIVAPGPTGFDNAATKLVEVLPGLFGWFWEVSYDLLIGWALFMVVAALVFRKRKLLFLEQVVAGVLSFVTAALIGLATGATWSELVHALGSSQPPAVFPAVRFALTTAVIVTASPHLSRPLRYLGRWVLFAGSLGAIAVGIATPTGVLTGLVIGMGAAALVHLVFGSPGGRLPPEQVAASLHDLGVETTEIEDARLQPGGAQLSTATTADARRLLVKVYGRDAWDGQFLTSVWSRLWYRDDAPSHGASRTQQVEHEAFVTLLAERSGISVLPVIAAGLATGRDALLVIEGRGRLLVQSDEPVDDAFLASAWAELRKLHGAGMAHGQIDAFRLSVLPGGGAALLDFADARVAAADSFQLADRAQLVVTTALHADQDRALDAAEAAIGSEGLAAVLPFLQPPVLTRFTRRALHDRDLDLDALREAAAKAAGVEVPKLEPIRRVTLGSVLMVVLVVFLAYTLISAISGVGLQNLIDELENASGPWLWIALAFSPVVLVPQAFACMGATERPVRLGPQIALESAIQFIQLAVPSSAARIALNIRFFQRAGATTTAAVAIGVIDGVSGFIVQIMLILVISLSGLGSLNLRPQSSSGSVPWTLILIGVAVVVIAVAIALMIPKVRSMIRARIADSRVALQVFRSPTKVAMLFFGNLAAQLMYALILGLCLRAFGAHIPFADCILVYTGVALFAGFMPVPGGIGVAEAAYTACLVALGVPHTVALATALTMRAVTYYLPPIWGGFAMKWLRNHSYV